SGGTMLGSVTNVVAYTDLDAFYLDSDVTSFNEHWVFENGYYPHLDGFSDTVDITNVETEIVQGTGLVITVNNTHKVQFSLSEEVTGVTLSEDGLLTVDTTVLEATTITVVVESLFDSTLTDEITLTVTASV
ncbi:MAG: hypothetical protein WCY80_06515, partial [Candidatus Izemoplasmatales bacterium]